MSSLLRRVFVRYWLATGWLVAASIRAESLPTQTQIRPLKLPDHGHTGFTKINPNQVGVHFTNVLSADRSITNQIYLNGSGVAAGDIDGDGWCDLFFCGLDQGNALYRNRGHWQFEDITDAAGVRCFGLDSTGAAFADINGDGHLDLLVNTIGHGTRCFLNDGHGHFRDATSLFGLEGNTGSTSLSLADIDGDGFLDLYVANYRRDTLRDQPNTRFRIKKVDNQLVVALVNGRPTTEPDLEGRYSVQPEGGIQENGEVSVLYRNQSGTNFVPIPFVGGAFRDENGQSLTNAPHDWSLSVMLRDLNGDALPDIYVCNDFESPDRIWINQGHGQFKAIARSAIRHTSLYSMGVDVADINRDGHDDIFVADMLSRTHARRIQQAGDPIADRLGIDGTEARPQYKMNTLLLNRGNGTYAEIARFAGVPASEWSWNPTFLDVDLDGYEDLLITNGHERDAQNFDIGMRLEAIRRSGKATPREILDARRQFSRLATANVAFRNRGDTTFEEAGAAWGFDSEGVSQGMALADLDNDGDLDVVINNLNEPPTLLRNETIAPRISVRLRGQTPNTHGIGSRIRVFGGPVEQSQEMIVGGRYLSSDDAIRTFAAPQPGQEAGVEVRWRSGRISRVDHVPANSALEIEEPASPSLPPASSQLPAPWFSDQSSLLGHTHMDESFDDFQRQPLLPSRLSHLGPGVAWCDLDGDGRENLVVGSGKGGSLAIWKYNGAGKLDRQHSPLLNTPLTRELSGLVCIPDNSGKQHLVFGVSTYSEPGASGSPAMALSPDFTALTSLGNPSNSCTGPLAVADINGDGELDLFIAGRVIPGRYPSPASSQILLHQEGRSIVDSRNAPVLAGIGMVSGAVFTDLNGDGWPDLVLATEWGPIRILINHQGIMVDETAKWGIDQLSGQWIGVATGDFDGDGTMDIIASNVGLNQLEPSSPQHPRALYWANSASTGFVDIIEAAYDAASNQEVPLREPRALLSALPGLQEKFGSYAAFGAASINTVLGTDIQRFKRVEASTGAAVILLNRGDHFEQHLLPNPAQWSAGFGVVIADWDGDGNQDIFLSQNFFGVRPGLARNDAGLGLLLRGDGNGGFTAIPPSLSGIAIDGEQRGAAVGDYDADGRPDLVVTQNRGETKLYHNESAIPALRVRLNAGPSNPHGVGVSIRAVYSNRTGPRIEVQSGSGYWSQNSPVLLVSHANNPRKLLVRWSGGKATEHDIPEASAEVELFPNGVIKTIR